MCISSIFLQHHKCSCAVVPSFFREGIHREGCLTSLPDQVLKSTHFVTGLFAPVSCRSSLGSIWVAQVYLVLGSGKRHSFWGSYVSIIQTCVPVPLPFQVKNILLLFQLLSLFSKLQKEHFRPSVQGAFSKKCQPGVCF